LNQPDPERGVGLPGVGPDPSDPCFSISPRQARTPFNVTGHPALAMMAGLSSGGLPLSVQFVGRYFAEAMVFQVARAWERAAGTDEKHPPID